MASSKNSSNWASRTSKRAPKDPTPKKIRTIVSVPSISISPRTTNTDERSVYTTRSVVTRRGSGPKAR